MAIIEFIIEVFVRIIGAYIFAFPGAILKWVFSDKKRSILQIYKNDDIFINGALGAIFIFGVVFIIFIALQNRVN